MSFDWGEIRYPWIDYILLKSPGRTIGVVFFSLACTLLALIFYLKGDVPIVVVILPAVILAVSTAIDVVARYVDRFEQVVLQVDTEIPAYMTDELLISNWYRPWETVETKGYAIARWIKKLDAIALEEGVHTIGSFQGYRRKYDEVFWHDPQEGLKTVTAIRNRLQSENIPQRTRNELCEDLDCWQDAMESAIFEGFRFNIYFFSELVNYMT